MSEQLTPLSIVSALFHKSINELIHHMTNKGNVTIVLVRVVNRLSLQTSMFPQTDVFVLSTHANFCIRDE